MTETFSNSKSAHFITTQDRGVFAPAQEELLNLGRANAIEWIIENCEWEKLHIADYHRPLQHLLDFLDANFDPKMLSYRDTPPAKKLLSSLARYIESGDTGELQSLRQEFIDAGLKPQYVGSAIGNRRLLELVAGEELEESLVEYISYVGSNDSFRTVVAVGCVSDAVGEPAFCAPLESVEEYVGIADTLSRVQPDLLAANIAKMVNKTALYVHAKKKLVGALPWHSGAYLTESDKVIWVAQWHTVILTMKESTVSKRCTFSFKIAKSLDKVDATQAKVQASIEKKTDQRFVKGEPKIEDFNLPKDDFFDAADKGRAELLRALKEQGAPKSIDPSRIRACCLFDLMRLGVRLERPETIEPLDIDRAMSRSWAGSVATELWRLRRSLLPGHFKTICENSWGKDYEKELAAYGMSVDIPE